jgi:catechol 2,3-dioxygenase-like lactoylglutathione lyase family enzyme
LLVLLFRKPHTSKHSEKQPIFGDELVTSFGILFDKRVSRNFCQELNKCELLGHNLAPKYGAKRPGMVALEKVRNTLLERRELLVTSINQTPSNTNWSAEGDVMKRTWTIIGVGDVPDSFKWYQALFGQPATLPAHDYFGQVLDSDGTVLLCLHEWGAHEHPSLMSPDHGTPGNGLLLFFRVDDFDLALQRAQSLATRLEEEPHLNPNTQNKEFSLRDPDGYYVTISALSAA